MSAHTPGPWVFEAGPKDDPDVPDADFIVAEEVVAGDVVATIISVRSGTSEANARLIAAAPELLACLKEAVASWDAKGIDETDDSAAGEAIAEWKAAIAKAERV